MESRPPSAPPEPPPPPPSVAARATDEPPPRPHSLHVVGWCLAVGALLLLPVAVSYLVQGRPARAWWVETGVALGFLSMALMLGQFATSGRFHGLARTIGQGTMLRIHAAAGIAAVLLLLGHPVVLLLADRQFLEFYDPRVNLPRAAALAAATGAALLLVTATLWRRALRLTYEWWRLSHGALAALLVFIGVVHMNMVGHHTGEWWKRVMWIAITAGALGMLLHSRLWRPLQLAKRPWTVAEVRPEHAGVTTLVLEPEGHDGLRFQTGHHVWLTLARSPFSLQQHPFTIASSDTRPDRIELTIKDLGDFTGEVQWAKRGMRAYLEGPYGAAWLHGLPADAPLVMIAGGIGITPFISALRSMRDHGWQRPFVLVHGVPDLDQATFRAELDDLAGRLGARFRLVPESAGDDWTGPRGMVDRDLLARHVFCQDNGDAGPLAPRPVDSHVVMCGPPAMHRALKRELADLGVPRRQIHIEEFDMV